MGQPAETHGAVRHPRDERPARLEPHVLPRALEQLGGDPRRPVAHLTRGARDRGPRVGDDAAPAGPHAEREEGRVTGAHDHVVERGAELGRGDLGERGRVPLTLRRDADEDVDRTARVHAHRRALVGAEPGALRVARQAHADAA